MSLKKILKVLKEDGIVLPKLNKYLLSIGDDEDRKHGMNSPSGASSCLLAQYMLRTGVKRNNVVEPRTRRIFDNGTHVHIRLQEYLKKEGILVLEETPVWNKDLKILGHCDGLLKISKLGLGILEIKSMNSNQFSALKQAKPDHIMQAQVYMYCLEKLRLKLQDTNNAQEFEAKKEAILNEYYDLQDSFVTAGKKFTKEEKIEMKMEEMEQALNILYGCLKPIDTMSLIYENKNDQDIKEFIVKWDEELVETIIERYEYLNECVENGEQPPRPPEATAKSCSTCRYCNYQFDCWH